MNRPVMPRNSRTYDLRSYISLELACTEPQTLLESRVYDYLYNLCDVGLSLYSLLAEQRCRLRAKWLANELPSIAARH